MRTAIHIYEKTMLKKILACKTTVEVNAIIDEKVTLIEKESSDKSTLNYFLDSSLFILKDSREHYTDAFKLSKLRVAICHFQTLKIHYKKLKPI